MQKQAQPVSGDRYRTERRLDYRIGADANFRPRSDYRKPMSKIKTNGFTVLELMVSVAIAGVLASIALPAFNGFVAQQRLTSAANGFAGAIAYARSESTRRGATVSLQAEGNDSGNEWGGGYCIVVGTPGGCPADALRTYDDLTQATMNGQGALNGLRTLSFNSRGLFTLGASGQIDLCSEDTLEDPGRRLEISVIGRLNVSELDCPDS